MKRYTAKQSLLTLAGVGLAMVMVGCSNEGATNNTAVTTTETGAAQVESSQPGEVDVVLQYTVTGMHCGGCAQSIASSVGRLEGVTSCEASFEESSTVVHASDAGVAEQVMEAIRELGYTVQPADEKPSGAGTGAS